MTDYGEIAGAESSARLLGAVTLHRHDDSEPILSVAAISLVGFLPADKALQHLGGACVPADPSPAALTAEWLAARGKLGTPVAKPGRPDIQPMPESTQEYIKRFNETWLQRLLFDADMGPPQFAMVEINPLLAFQLTIESGRSDFHCGGTSSPPTVDEMLPKCLPMQVAPETMNIQQQENSLLIKARSLNIRRLAFGNWQNEFFGITVGPTLPMLQVVRFNDRYYLWNGFHRSYGFAKAGATHVPCIIRDAVNHDKVAQVIGQTFGPNVFEANDPPTVGHFTQDRAYPVTLKSTSRVIHISWAEWAVAED